MYQPDLHDVAQNSEGDTGHPDYHLHSLEQNINLELPVHFNAHIPITEPEIQVISSSNMTMSDPTLENVSISSIPVEVDNLLFQSPLHTLQPTYPQLPTIDPYSFLLLPQSESQPIEPPTSTSKGKGKDRSSGRKNSVKEKTNICDYCGKSFAYLSGMNKHIYKVHSGQLQQQPQIVNTEISDTVSVPKIQSNVKIISLLNNENIEFDPVPDDFKIGAGQPKSHKCSTCGSAFSSPYILNMHMITHTNTETVPCDVCQDLVSMMDLTAHFMEKHVINTSLSQPMADSYQPKSNRPFVCTVCHKEFKARKDIQKHVTSHTSIRPWKCQFCPESFPSFSHLSEHLRTHVARTIKCRYCEKIFKTHSVRCRHERTIHQGDRTHLVKKFKCDHCERLFVSMAKLKTHMNSHLGIKPYECLLCPCKYTHGRDLNKHFNKLHPDFKIILRPNGKSLLVGPRDKPWPLVTYRSPFQHKGGFRKFKCLKCRSSFGTFQRLNLHSLIHRDTTLVLCDFCKEALPEGLHLSHYMSIHTSYSKTTSAAGVITSRTFSCNICNYSTEKKKHMEKHFVKHTKVRPWKCDVCESKFVLIDYLIEHMKTHEDPKLKCRKCDKEFRTYSLRGRHERVIHEGKKMVNRFHCPTCGKAFPSHYRVKVHMACHTGEKNFFCSICPKREYAYKDDLRKHMKRCHRDVANYSNTRNAGPRVKSKAKENLCKNPPVGFNVRSTDSAQYAAPQQLSMSRRSQPANEQQNRGVPFDILLEAAQSNDIVPTTSSSAY